MKNRVLAILLASAVTLAGCGEKSSGEDEKWHLINNYTLDDTSRNGTFVTTAYERLDFLDYDSMIQSPVCDDPTCEHKDEKKCPAFGKSNHPFIRNDKLYYFKETDFYNLGEEQYVFDTELWRCDLNGSNDKMLDTFKGLDLRSFDTIVRRGDKLYIPFSKEIFDSDFSCAEPSVVLYEYDLVHFFDGGHTVSYKYRCLAFSDPVESFQNVLFGVCVYGGYGIVEDEYRRISHQRTCY